MMKNFFSILLFLTVGFSLHGAVLFEPGGFTSAKSTWHKTSGTYADEYYANYFYHGKVVFRVLERFTPSVDSKIVVAKENKAQLKLESTTIINFDSEDLIAKNFSIRYAKRDDTTLDPKQISLDITYRGCLGNKKTYFVSFSEDSDEIRISKEAYNALKIAKSAALTTGKFLKIDLAELGKNKGANKDLVSLETPANSDNAQCAVCMNHEKNTMLEPCNHICLCEGCAEKTPTNCPICRADVTGKKKVFY